MISARARPIAPPRPPELPTPRRFPLIATVAPLVVSFILFAVTRSPFTLVFAALGPVVAVASTVDGARERKRTRRRETTRFEHDIARVSESIDAAHREERTQLAIGGGRELLDRPEAVLARWRESEGDPVVSVGSADRPSAIGYDTGPASSTGDPLVDNALAELALRASVIRDAPVDIAIGTGIGIVGPSQVVAASARAIIVQLAASLSPRDWMLASSAGSEQWLELLPHAPAPAPAPEAPCAVLAFVSRERTVRIVTARVSADLPRELGHVLELSATGMATIGGLPLRPDVLGQQQAAATAELLAAVAGRAGVRSNPVAGLPAVVDFCEIEARTEVGSAHASAVEFTTALGLSAPVGVGADGVVVLDLAAHGPHAIVGGTTGSGKSELLLSWVLGIAGQRSPAEVTFLFVDFKGGASFGSLLELPHSLGVVTDLDAEQALRVLASLTAELRHRERDLAAHSLRGIDDSAAPPFPRLVVVVDEYAALVETFPLLHAVFADIAARGRSLGVHLILCTQRPAGVVRDGILANCALRISLRVTNAADSVAVLGADAAASLPARPLGRALASSGGERPTEFQVALSTSADVERVRTRWRDSAPPRKPWLPPLPSALPIAALPAGDLQRGIVFAMADLPSEQAQRPVAYQPGEHGSLLVIGTARSGKTGVLAALRAARSDCELIALPSQLPQIWDFLGTAMMDRSAAANHPARVVLLDDIDSVLARCPEVYQVALLEGLTRLLRDGPASGLWCVLTTQRVTGALSGLSSLCGSALMLRMVSRAEHALAGGEPGEFVAGLVPGAGLWRGMRIQVALAAAPPSRSDPIRSVLVNVSEDPIAVVSTRPEQFAAALRKLAPDRRFVVLAPAALGQSGDLEVSRGGVAPVLLADPELWQSQWTLFTRLQRGSILFDGCSVAELRALTRSRELPPPFGPGIRPLWLRDADGALVRATLAGAEPGDT